MKIEQQEEKVVPLGEDDSNETGKILVLDEKVHQNKGFANINILGKSLKIIKKA